MNLDLLSIAFGLLAGAALTGLLMDLRDVHRRLRELEARPKRLPYQSADDIENAMAAILTLQYDVQIKLDMVENALEWLRKARNPGKEGKGK